MKFKNNSLITAFMFTLSLLVPLSYNTSVKADNGRNTIYYEDFESTAFYDTWSGLGGAPIQNDTSKAFTGKSSLTISQRSQGWDGPAINLTNIIKPNVEYDFSVMVYHESGIDQNIMLTAKTIKSLNAGDGEYSKLNQMSVPSGEWTELTGAFTFPEADADCPNKEYTIYIETENNSRNLSYNIDDFTIYAPEGERALDGSSGNTNPSKLFTLESSNVPTGNNKYLFDFEKDSSSANFIPHGKESLVVSNEANSDGSHSLYVYDRNGASEGAVLAVDFLELGTRYDFSAEVMFNDNISAGKAEFEVDLLYDQDDKTYCEVVNTSTVQQNEWTKLSGVILVPDNAKNGYFFIHTASSDDDSEDSYLSFYLDNVMLTDSVSTDMNKIFILIFIVTLVAISISILVLVLKKTKGSKNNIPMSPNLSDTDLMTPTKNKKAYEDKIFDLINHPEECKNIHIALCDINHLQYINDNYSREKGDEAVIRCAKALVKATGKRGTVYRTSGDEFMCISEESLEADITRELKSEVQNYHGYPFSVASGFACYDVEKDADSPDIRNIIIRADEALSENKQNVKESESN